MSATLPISASTRRMASATATAGQTAFPYTFPLIRADDIRVRRTRAGTTVTLSQSTDFTVSGVGNAAGGTVTLVAGSLAGDIIDIDGLAGLDRVTGVTSAGRFSSAQIDRDFDLALIRDQELRRDVGDLQAAPGIAALQETVEDYIGSSLVQGPGISLVYNDTTGKVTVSNVGIPGSGSGNVVGPASSVNNRVAVLSGTTGKLIADSGVSLDHILPSNVGARFQTVASVNLSQFSAAPPSLTIAGYYAAGDCGDDMMFRYVASQPAHSGKLSATLLGGATVWYELQADKADFRCFGAKINGTSSDDALTAFTAAKSYALAKGVPLYGAPGVFYSSAPLTIDNIGLLLDPGCVIRRTTTGLPFDAFNKYGQYIDSDVFSGSRFPASQLAQYGESIFAIIGSDLTSGQAGPVPHRIDTFYDGTAQDAYNVGVSNYYSFIQYGEQKKSLNQWASGTLSLYGGHVNVFSAGKKLGGTGASELTPLALGINFRNDALLSPGYNIYNDIVVSGPRNTDAYFLESFMAGLSTLVQKHNPGTQRDATHLGSYGLSVVTRPQSGGFSSEAWTGSSYELRAGLVVAGFAGPQTATDGDQASATAGYTYGVLVGGGPAGEGGGSVWLGYNTRSKVAYGAYISDYMFAGLKIDRKNPSSNPYSIHVTANSGPALLENGMLLTNLPTSATGQPSGTLWRDAGADNVIKVVP